MATAPDILINLIDAELTVVRLGKKDTLVLFSDDELSRPVRSILTTELHKRFPDNPLLILDKGKKLGAMSLEPASPACARCRDSGVMLYQQGAEPIVEVQCPYCQSEEEQGEVEAEPVPAPTEA